MNPADLGLTARAPLGMESREGVTLPPWGRITLAELSGCGTIRQVFLAIGGAHAAYDARLEVTTDGAAAPDVSADLGTLFATHFGQQLNRQYSSARAHVEINANGGGTVGYMLKLDAPFRDGALVTISNPTADTVTLYSQVAYTAEADPAPLRLRSAGYSWAQSQLIRAGGAVTLLDRPGAGWLAWLAITGQGVSNVSWLERDVEIAVNGAATPQYRGSGFEDFFGGSYYFQGRQGFGMPWALIGNVDPANRTASLACDLRELYGGVRYDAGVTVTLGTEAVVSTDHRQSALVLFYEDLTA